MTLISGQAARDLDPSSLEGWDSTVAPYLGFLRWLSHRGDTGGTPLVAVVRARVQGSLGARRTRLRMTGRVERVSAAEAAFLCAGYAALKQRARAPALHESADAARLNSCLSRSSENPRITATRGEFPEATGYG